MVSTHQTGIVLICLMHSRCDFPSQNDLLIFIISQQKKIMSKCSLRDPLRERLDPLPLRLRDLETLRLPDFERPVE